MKKAHTKNNNNKKRHELHADLALTKPTGSQGKFSSAGALVSLKQAKTPNGGGWSCEVFRTARRSRIPVQNSRRPPCDVRGAGSLPPYGVLATHLAARRASPALHITTPPHRRRRCHTRASRAALMSLERKGVDANTADGTAPACHRCRAHHHMAQRTADSPKPRLTAI